MTNVQEQCRVVWVWTVMIDFRLDINDCSKQKEVSQFQNEVLM